MADLGEDEDYDLKDEELVDFEGSDYGFESAEEEETVVAPGAPLPTAKVAPALGSGEIENVKDEGDGVIVQPPVIVVVDHPSKYRLARKPDLEDGELDDAAMVIILFTSPYLHANAPSLSSARHLSSFSIPVLLWSRVSHLSTLSNSSVLYSLALNDISCREKNPPLWLISFFFAKEVEKSA